MTALRILKEMGHSGLLYQASNALGKGNRAVYEDHNKFGDSVIVLLSDEESALIGYVC